MDCSLPGSSIHGIFRARVLEWVATAFYVPMNDFSQKLLISNKYLQERETRSCLLCEESVGYTHPTPVFIAALFTIAKTWKQVKCPSTEEWIKKMWSIHTMEYYSAIRRNKTVPFAEMWMDLEIVIQSEVSQKEKNTIY